MQKMMMAILLILWHQILYEFSHYFFKCIEALFHYETTKIIMHQIFNFYCYKLQVDKCFD